MTDEPDRTPTGWPDEVEVARAILDLRLGVAGAIRRRREASGMTQGEFAARIGVTAPYLARIENGRGVSLDRLLGAFFACGAGAIGPGRVNPGDAPDRPGTPGA